MILNELFDRTVEYSYNEMSDGVDAYFTIGEIEYEVSIEPRRHGTAHIAFYGRKGDEAQSAGITGTGNAIVVFSTVIAILKEYLQKSDTDILIFNAMEPSRRKLYDRIAKTFEREGWTNEGPSDGKYVMVAPESQ